MSIRKFKDNPRYFLDPITRRYKRSNFNNVSQNKENVEDIKKDILVSKEDNASLEDIMDTWVFNGDVPGKFINSSDLIDHDENISLLKEEIDKLKNSSDSDALFELASNITNGENFNNILYSKEYNNRIFNEKSERFWSLSRSLDKSIKHGERFPYNTDDFYNYGQEAKKSHLEEMILKKKLEDYKNVFSEAVFHAKNNMDSTSYITERNQSGIGKMFPIGNYEPGTREWLELRQSGLGGSDIGTLASEYQRVFDDEGNFVKMEKNPYYSKNVQDIISSKIEEISDEQVEKQTSGQVEFNDPISRGNAQEDFIGLLMSHRTGQHLIHDKQTFRHPDHEININYDFLISNDKGEPIGVGEIKTSSHPEQWGKEELGLEGVPYNYQIQTIVGARLAGLEKASVSVLINESDFRYYESDMTDDMNRLADEYIEYADNYYKNIKEHKEAGKEDDLFENKSSKKKSEFTFGMSYNTTGMRGDKGRYMERISKMTNDNVENVKQKFLNYMGPDKSSWSYERINDGLKMLMQEADFSGQRHTGVDIETNHYSALKGDIIEIGIIDYDMDTGDRKHSVSELYSPSETSLRMYGTGAEHVHNISHEDVSSKDSFYDEKVQEKLLNDLTRNRVVWSHNSQFEKSWLRANLKGFAREEANGNIYMADTMDIARRAMPSSENNSLKSFCENNNVEYVNAHRAYNDTEMMMDALRNYSVKKTLGGEERVINS